MSRTTPITFDPRPLTEPVDRAAAKAFVRELRAQGRAPGWFSGSAVAITVALIAIPVLFLGVFGPVFTTILSAAFSFGGPLALLLLIPALLVVGVVAVLLVALVRGAGGSTRWYRLDRFARANGMTFLPALSAPPLPGLIFQRGSARQSTDLVRGATPRFVEFANYRYTTGSGKNRTTHRWGYVAIRLDVPLPHILLDAVGNNGLFGVSNLPAAIDREQRLSLEGDFDRYFSLYCPEGYERDALYLFTPDIMARFIDNAAELDVEIVDDWLFLYAKRDLSTLDPATWAWLFSVVAALLDKFAQWARWRDERLAGSAADAERPADAAHAVRPADAATAAVALPAVTAASLTPPPPGVATPGRRLRRRASWVTGVALALVALWWVVGILFQVVAR